MSFPLILLCGTTGSSRVVEPRRVARCPVCAAPAVRLIEHTSRCCFFFIPLCAVGDASLTAVCAACGARMPPALVAAGGGTPRAAAGEEARWGG